MRPGSGGARAAARRHPPSRPGLSRARRAASAAAFYATPGGAASAPTALRAPGWLAYAASILIAVAVAPGGTVLLTGERHNDTIANEVIDSHLRSLLGTHLIEVASSDTHTVKPWFAGRTDLSPPGVDLAAEDFPLIGGRLDLIQGNPVPALVYRAGKHIINVFVLPARPGDFGETLARRGYMLRHWNEGDIGYWAVSDASPDEFRKFEHAFRAASGGDPQSAAAG